MVSTFYEDFFVKSPMTMALGGDPWCSAVRMWPATDPWCREACQGWPKANGIDGYDYLRKLLTALPMAGTADDYESLLPWSVSASAV